MCCICINCSACCLATQQLVFWTPSYLHRLCCFHSINMLWVAAPNLLKGILYLKRECHWQRWSEMVQSPQFVLRLLTPSSSHPFGIGLCSWFSCCAAEYLFHDSTLDSKQGALSITFYCSKSYRARSRLADHIWSLGLFRRSFWAKELRERFPYLGILRASAGVIFGGWFGCDSPRLPPDDTLLEVWCGGRPTGPTGPTVAMPRKDLSIAKCDVMACASCLVSCARTTPCCEQRSAQRLSQPPRYGWTILNVALKRCESTNLVLVPSGSQTGWKGERKGITWVFPWDFPGRIAPPAFGMLSAFPSRPSQMAEVCWSSEW